MSKGFSAINRQMNQQINYKVCIIRLTGIILLSELAIMILFDETGLGSFLGNPWKALADGLLLVLLSSYPLYRWVYLPIVNVFKQQQDKLAMLAEALQGAGDSAIITNANGNILYVNKSFTQVTGYTSEEVIGKNPSVLSSGIHDSAFYEKMWRKLIATGEWQGELWNKRKSGEIYPEALNIRAIKGKDGNVRFYVGIFSDLTEKKAIEHALMQSQKLEAIGTLVGGVAHNFNNMLAAISGKAYLGYKSNNWERVKKQLHDIQTLSKDAAELVKQLLTFARETEQDKQHIPFAPMLKDAVQTARIGIPENVEVTLDAEDTAEIIYGDAAHLKQAIINMLNNARDAVADAPVKSISIKMRVIERSKCEFSNQCNNTCRRVFQTKISDTGSGIGETEISKIFDPFFTTKEQGKGTGLGLSTALGTIHEHGGTINIESQRNKGSTFTICLPVDENGATSETDRPKEVPASHRQTILVVDDSDHVRETAVEILQSLGYKTLEANNGKAAIEQFKTHMNEIDLILTDIVMPKMDGFDMALVIRKMNNSIPIIFMTGYDSHGRAHQLNDDFSVVLDKPFTAEGISVEIHRLLDQQ